ncbi:MAG: hypothetical protein HQ592_15985 [Planctomycetes bacterium]|nr:hypothetical protein [Planctomycetota bacterium]
MPEKLKEAIRPKLLLVEGPDDKRFFGALVDHMELKQVQIIHLGIKREFRRELMALVSLSSFSIVESLGVVRDADTNPAGAFESVRDALRAAGLSVPERPLALAGDSPRVAVMIVPGDESCGALEDLCLEAVAHCPALSCVNQLFECLQEKGTTSPVNLPKGKVQAFLATRHKPGLRIGEAAEKGYWPWASGAFDRAKEFLGQIVA